MNRKGKWSGKKNTKEKNDIWKWERNRHWKKEKIIMNGEVRKIKIWRQRKYEKNGKKKIITIEKKMREDRKEKENL